jgi:hypothetical protein
MNKLQLIMVCGVVLAAGVTFQVASDAKLNQASNLTATHAMAKETRSLPSVHDIN